MVETSLTGYTAQAYRLDEPPPFGGLVRVRDRAGTCDIYGVVIIARLAGSILVGGLPLVARPNPPPATNRFTPITPSLAVFLKTEFGVLVLGCRPTTAGRFSYIFPDYPPPLHYGVALCGDETLTAFTEEFSYMRTILNAANVPAEELLGAMLRRADHIRGENGRAFLVESLRYLARQLKQDYDRFKIIVEKCEVA